MSPAIMAKIIVTNGPVSFMALAYYRHFKIIDHPKLYLVTQQRTLDRTRPSAQRTREEIPPAVCNAVSRSPPRTSQVWGK